MGGTPFFSRSALWWSLGSLDYRKKRVVVYELYRKELTHKSCSNLHLHLMRQCEMVCCMWRVGCAYRCSVASISTSFGSLYSHDWRNWWLAVRRLFRTCGLYSFWLVSLWQVWPLSPHANNVEAVSIFCCLSMRSLSLEVIWNEIVTGELIDNQQIDILTFELRGGNLVNFEADVVICCCCCAISWGMLELPWVFSCLVVAPVILSTVLEREVSRGLVQFLC